MKLGTATIAVTKRIDRCAATDVDPSLGVRDMRMVELLERSFDHHDCGVYAEIVESGVVMPGDVLSPA